MKLISNIKEYIVDVIYLGVIFVSDIATNLVINIFEKNHK